MHLKRRSSRGFRFFAVQISGGWAHFRIYIQLGKFRQLTLSDTQLNPSQVVHLPKLKPVVSIRYNQIVIPPVHLHLELFSRLSHAFPFSHPPTSTFTNNKTLRGSNRYLTNNSRWYVFNFRYYLRQRFGQPNTHATALQSCAQVSFCVRAPAVDNN